MASSIAVKRHEWRDFASSPYANGAGAALLAAAATASIIGCTTSSTTSSKAGVIGVLGGGQALVYVLAGSLSRGYRVASAVALLTALLTASIPGLLHATPVSTSAALMLAATGSLPMWAVAGWRLALARRVALGAALDRSREPR